MSLSFSAKDNKINKDIINHDDEDDDDNNIKIINNNIYVYSSINNTTALKIILSLKTLDKKYKKYKNKHINMFINSPGGYLHEGLAIMDFIINMKTPVYSYIQGSVASAATLISIVCKKRFIYKNSYMLIHQLSSGVHGKYTDIKDEFKSCKSLMQCMTKIYKKYTNLSKPKLLSLLKREKWLTSKLCIKYKLVDEII